jgi:hypothetical protein
MIDALAFSADEVAKFGLSDEELVRIAIAEGKSLKIGYDEGTQPGSVRLVRPVRYTERFLLAFDGQTAKPKKFRIDAYWVADKDEPVTYRPGRLRRVEIDPDLYFASFAFEIKRPAFLPAFDFMRSERTAVIAGVKQRRRIWTQGVPPRFEFDIGDVLRFPSPYFRAIPGFNRESVLVQVRESSRRELRATAFRPWRAGSWREHRSATFVPSDFVDLLRAGPHSVHWTALF